MAEVWALSNNLVERYESKTREMKEPRSTQTRASMASELFQLLRSHTLGGAAYPGTSWPPGTCMIACLHFRHHAFGPFARAPRSSQQLSGGLILSRVLGVAKNSPFSATFGRNLVNAPRIALLYLIAIE